MRCETKELLLNTQHSHLKSNFYAIRKKKKAQKNEHSQTQKALAQKPSQKERQIVHLKVCRNSKEILCKD